MISIDPVAAVLGLVAIGLSLYLILAPKHSLDRKRTKTENYLRRKKEQYWVGESDTYQHSPEHLSAVLGISQGDLLEISDKSDRIKRVPRAKGGMATGHLYEYGKKD